MAVELALDPTVVADAGALRLDASGAVRAALREEVSRERTRRWAEENREAIGANNARIER